MKFTEHTVPVFSARHVHRTRSAGDAQQGDPDYDGNGWRQPILLPSTGECGRQRKERLSSARRSTQRVNRTGPSTCMSHLSTQFVKDSVLVAFCIVEQLGIVALLHTWVGHMASKHTRLKYRRRTVHSASGKYSLQMRIAFAAPFRFTSQMRM